MTSPASPTLRCPQGDKGETLFWAISCHALSLCHPSPHTPKAGLSLTEGPGGGGGKPTFEEGADENRSEGRELLP